MCNCMKKEKAPVMLRVGQLKPEAYKGISRRAEVIYVQLQRKDNPASSYTKTSQ